MFDFSALYEAYSVAEAVKLRQAHPKAKIIAGGSDQLVKLRDGKLAGCELISIYTVDELRGVSMAEDGTLRIGALTSFTDVSENELIKRHVPVLGYAAGQVGGPQVRNIGTIGGNVCNGVTSADTGATLLAWDGVMELTGPEGVRHVPAARWYIRAGQVDIRPGEILTAVTIPQAAYEGYAGWYIKYAMRNAMDIATLGCSVNVCLTADKQVLQDVRIAYGVAGPVPMRAPAAEAAGRGQPVCPETIEQMARAVGEDVHPRTSWRAKAEFRSYLAQELLRRCLFKSVERAGGVIHGV
ncbi:MAG: xanthine dehydrogenase FAD-binding subunit XdhB [Oscillospiraceae bacterium]|nr:xanthine dehydrogenase FAD-binding subunit XdhB [Oscillospiraceae bacterium]